MNKVKGLKLLLGLFLFLGLLFFGRQGVLAIYCQGSESTYSDYATCNYNNLTKTYTCNKGSTTVSGSCNNQAALGGHCGAYISYDHNCDCYLVGGGCQSRCTQSSTYINCPDYVETTPTPTPTPTPTRPPATCPNGFCGSGETCSNCSADCGSCPTPTPTPDSCAGNYWKCSGTICLSGGPGDNCGSCPLGCNVAKGTRAFIVFNDTNQNGVWDYSTEKRISSGTSATCPGTNVEYVPGFGISVAGTSYSIDSNCNIGETEDRTSSDALCNGKEDPCYDGNNDGFVTSCFGEWGDSDAIYATCVDQATCEIGCKWTGNGCKGGGDTAMGALCSVRGGAYCTNGVAGTLRDGPLLKVKKGEDTYAASVTIPTGWQASAGSPQSIALTYWGGVRGGCLSTVDEPNGGLVAFGVVRSPLPNPTGLTTTCNAVTGNQVTLSWNNVAGAADYTVRVDRNDGLTPEWYNQAPTGGDQIFLASNACSTSGGKTTCVVNVTAGSSYTNWSVQPMAAGESYPYVTPATDGGGFQCTVPGVLTGTFFDASDLSSCPADPQTLSASLKINGGTLTMTGGPGYSANTAANGLYTISGITTPNTYSLTAIPSSTYISTPKFSCQGTTATYLATGGTLTRDFGFWGVYGGWFQALGGSVYGGSGITSNIPGTMPAAERYLILNDANAQNGLAYYKSGSISLGTYPGLTVSLSGWNANSGYTGDKQDYAYWSAKMGIYTKTVWDWSGKPSYAPGTNGYEIYTRTGTATIDFSPLAGEKVIYLINGDVDVTSNVTVPKTAGNPSFLAVIASGTITFASNVDEVHGLWVGNSINIASTGNTATEKQFIGEGSFVGWGSIILSRDLGSTNNLQPSEGFIYRPDLIINAPAPMKLSDTVFRLETP